MSSLDILRTCSYALNWLLYFYLVHHIFPKKLNSMHIILIICMTIIGSLISSNLFYLNFIYKNIVSLIIFISTCYIIYHKPLKRLLMIYIYNFILSIIGEALIAPIFIDSNLSLSSWSLAFTMQNLFFFIEIKIFLIFYHKKIHNLLTEHFSYLLIISLLILFSVFTCIFMNMHYIKYISLALSQINMIIFISFIIMLILFVLSIIKLQKIYTELKNKWLIQSLLDEYQKQCFETTKHQQQLEYQRLRHDIINYIETYQRLYKKDDSYENIQK
ncbi:hypothetical protein [Massilimicrobiota timonensis]|uniref:Uncharacterized protein n=1 Tax=Massilimicrobiota timonensis TaxID=1776392 RepID=A0A1Y4SXP5_9FIRM|nr:hypothetical protein [Massilimicrobiota timonensis]OUQ34686.1 hypothetical protein B5E75_05990 [Massilimicrobiota timonensis]